MGTFRHATTIFPILVGVATLLGACDSDDPGSAPIIDPLNDDVALIDSEYTLTIRATDPDGDPLTFRYTSTIEDIGSRADLRQATNKAVFRWTPIAADRGIQAFDFTVSDGSNVSKATVNIDVRPAAGTSTAPIFRKPLGTGTTLDLATKDCINVDIVVEDSDTPGVDIRQEDPILAEAELKPKDGSSAEWSWCPSEAQIDKSDRHVLRLSANDHTNPPTLKNYLIVLRKPVKGNCPGGSPVIEHTELGDVSEVVGLNIAARITDDVGIKYEPTLHYSEEPPSDPPDLSTMTQVTMELESGDMQDGTWKAVIPNPIASEPVGASATIHYLIVALDNDDKEGDCDHRTTLGPLSARVTNPGGAGGLGLCEPCTTDSQCGGDGDLCMIMGADYDSYCFSACSGDGDCTEYGYHCSEYVLLSVDGKEAHQCIPHSFRCDGGTVACTDDDWEENDTKEEAFDNPGLPPGQHANMKTCPGSLVGDEDWYPIDLEESGTIVVLMDGSADSDLDLMLIGPKGEVLDKSEGLSSTELVEACVDPNSFPYVFLRVYSFQNKEVEYSLEYEFTPESCTPNVCADDEFEDDDNASQSRDTDLSAPPFTSNTNAICSGDEDWFQVMMLDNETLYATLTFEQPEPDEGDLDIILYKDSEVLTPCFENNPDTCQQELGQSSNSNESLIWPVGADGGGNYYVVVRGWHGDENLYDLCLGLEPNHCPVP